MINVGFSLLTNAEKSLPAELGKDEMLAADILSRSEAVRCGSVYLSGSRRLLTTGRAERMMERHEVRTRDPLTDQS